MGLCASYDLAADDLLNFGLTSVNLWQECAQIIYTKKTKNKKTTSEWIDHGLLQFACQSEQDTEPQVSPSPLTCACDK